MPSVFFIVLTYVLADSSSFLSLQTLSGQFGSDKIISDHACSLQGTSLPLLGKGVNLIFQIIYLCFCRRLCSVEFPSFCVPLVRFVCQEVPLVVPDQH